MQLRFDLGTTAQLTEAQRTLALARLAPRLVGTELVIEASEHRSQWRNRAAARQRLAELLREALTPRPERRATKPTRGSQRRRLAAKTQRSQLKQTRRRPDSE